MSLRKLAETIELSVQIPDDEKKIAASAVLHLEKFLKKLNAFNKHLNIIYNPFKEFQSVSDDSVKKYRSALWTYRGQIAENFQELKDLYGLCVKDVGYFDSDTDIIQLLNAFADDMDGFETQEKTLLNALANWDTSNYKDNIVNTITNVKQEIAEMRQMINDRIIDHINTNILVKDWSDGISDDLKKSIKEKEPLIVQLYKEREEQLKKLI
jgi:hypothetical protein